MGEVLTLESLDLSLTFVFFADQHSLRPFRKRSYQYVRVDGNDQLSTGGRIYQQVSDFWNNVGMQAQFRLFDTNERRWGWVKQQSNQA